MKNNTQPRRRVLVILGIMLVIAVCLLLFKQRGGLENAVTITNLDSCTKDIVPATAQKLETSMYGFVKTANQFNNVKTSSRYTGTIRDNTCHTQHDTASQQTSFTVDIPKAKQSWGITFSWITPSQPAADLGSVIPSCLADKDLLYGDFNCISVISTITPSTAKTDPLLAHLPHSTLDYTLSATKGDGKIIVTAQLFLTEADQSDPAAAVAQYKQEVINYITSVGIDPNNYTIQYSY